VLVNLLSNAVKFTSSGGAVSIVARPGGNGGDRTMTFVVRDTGPGIAPENLERIFEPFSRGGPPGSAGAAPGGGTGLGLTIAKMLTDLMGGELTVSTKLGEGTVFRVRLFLPELRGQRAPAPRPARRGYEGARRRLLVVDNEEVDRTLLARRLQALGFDVLEAGSGQAALALLHEAQKAQSAEPPAPVHAILMDLAMPGIDGWQTIRSLRAQGLSEAPVAIVSANAFDKGLENDCGITPADFITKPVRFDELLDWLGQHLALVWLSAPASPPPPPATAPADAPLPTRAQLLALQEMVRLGYPRGVQQALTRIESERPECAAWLAPLRALTQAFQFEGVQALIDQALARAEPA
jgi:CheY-like chemotaxis protein